MSKKFTLAFKIVTSSLPSEPPWADAYWMDCNPSPIDAFPETEKENLSVFLYSSLLGGNPIELKLESYGEAPNQKQFRSAPIPWNYANGSSELLEYSGLSNSDPYNPLPLSIQYFLEAREVVAGGESFPHEGSGPDWDQIDASTMTREWIWYLTAVWTYDNQSQRFLLIPDCMERSPEAWAGPGARTLFGDYYVVSNHWEAMYWEDGMGYVDGYYDGLTNERTLFKISQTDHLNG